jgi:hypothetical protein
VWVQPWSAAAQCIAKQGGDAVCALQECPVLSLMPSDAVHGMLEQLTDCISADCNYCDSAVCINVHYIAPCIYVVLKGLADAQLHLLLGHLTGTAEPLWQRNYCTDVAQLV